MCGVLGALGRRCESCRPDSSNPIHRDSFPDSLLLPTPPFGMALLKNRIKVFKPFQSTLKQAQEMMEIEYVCVYKRSSQPVMKGLKSRNY